MARHHGYGKQRAGGTGNTTTVIRAAVTILMLLLWRAASGDDMLFFGCTSCHGEQGRGNEALDAPAIAGMEPRYFTTQMRHFRDGVRGRSLKDLHGRQMGLIAAVLLDDQDIRSLAAYVAGMPRSKPLTTLPPPRGGAAGLYAACSACHGSNGEGSAALRAPPIAWLDDWYLLRQLRNFKAGIRGADQRDTGGLQMRASVATLSDAEMRALAAYVVTLSGVRDHSR